MPKFNFYLPNILFVLFLLMDVACGHHNKKQSNKASETNTGGDGNTYLSNSESLIGHPAGCVSCTPPPLQNPSYPGCTTPIGTVQACEGLCFVADNVTPIYNNTIPSSGPCYASYDTNFYQVFTEAAPLARGTWVHNLAHGYILLIYHCATGVDCSSDVAIMQKAINSTPGNPTILTPDPLLQPGTYAIIAWNYVYTFDSRTISKDDLVCFIRQHALYFFPHGTR